METGLRSEPTAYAVFSLETFLGGMETPERGIRRCNALPPLKPSLVEWKRERRGVRDLGAVGLETFLGGMETGGTSIYERSLELP